MSRTHRSTRRNSVAAAVALAACLACRGTRDRASNSTATTATAATAETTATTATTSTPNATTPEDLTFTGAVNGHMSNGRQGDVYFCGKLGPRFTAEPIHGDVAGTPFDFSITIASGYKGPGTYVSGKELTPGSGYAAVTVGLAYPGSGTKDFVNGIGSHTVVVNADERSGKVTADLHSSRGKPGAIHVTGTWQCPPN